MSQTYGEMRTEKEKRYDNEVLNRVKEGIAFLERVHGPDFVDHIDLDVLNLRSGASCVLGQVFAEEAANDNYCGDAYYWATERGFTEELSDGGESRGFLGTDSDDWDALHEAWVDVLTPMVVKNDG